MNVLAPFWGGVRSSCVGQEFLTALCNCKGTIFLRHTKKNRSKIFILIFVLVKIYPQPYFLPKSAGISPQRLVSHL